MAEIRPSEISEILKNEIKGFEGSIAIRETGRVLSCSDGIARIYGLQNAAAGELLEFPHSIMGLVLNLEEDNVGAALFGEQPRLFCEIAEWNGEVAGFAVWFINFSTFSGRSGIYLEDLFVRPALRGKGIGKALLSHLAKQCVANGWSRLQWSVVDWNTPSIEFYKSLGAQLMDEWTVCRVGGPALTALAQGKR